MRKIMLLAVIVTVTLSLAAPALACSQSANNSAEGSSAEGNFAKNKDFAGLVDIGGGRQRVLLCLRNWAPPGGVVSGGGGRA